MTDIDTPSLLLDALARAMVANFSTSSYGPEGCFWRWRSGDDHFKIAIPRPNDGAPELMSASWSIDGVLGEIDPGDPEAVIPRIAAIMADAFPAPFGRILRSVEEDRFGNKVSIALLRSGKRMRIVHHPFRPKPGRRFPNSPRYHYSTVYSGRGVFVKMTEDRPDNDCMCQTLKLAGYEVSWGDGELLDVHNAEGGPDVKSAFHMHAQNESFETATLIILSAIADIPDMWQMKEPAPVASTLRAA